MSNVLKTITEAVVDLDEKAATIAVEKALKEGIDAQDIIVDGLQPGLKIIGDKFASREFFLPELIQSAELMKSISAVLQPYLEKQKTAGAKKAIKVVLGSAKEDIHDIGKNIVGLVLSANGFEVYDIGVDVSPEKFAEKINETNADVVAISALLATVIGKVHETIDYFNDNDIKAKVIVGGAAFTEESAKSVGADGYAADAWGAVDAINSALGGK